MYRSFFCGYLASATAFKTSLFASAINAVGKWSDKGPFGSGSEAEMSTLLKYLYCSKQSSKQFAYCSL